MVPGDVVRRHLHNRASFFQPETSPPSRTSCVICTTQWATVLTPKHTNSTQTVESASLMTWSSRWDRAESEASGNLPINSSMQVDTFIKKKATFPELLWGPSRNKDACFCCKVGHFDTLTRCWSLPQVVINGTVVLFGFIFKLQRFPIVFYIQSVPTATQTRTGVARITSCSTYFWVCLQVTLDGSSKQTWIFTNALPRLVYSAEVLLVALLLFKRPKHEHLRQL